MLIYFTSVNRRKISISISINLSTYQCDSYFACVRRQCYACAYACAYFTGVNIRVLMLMLISQV